MRLAVIASICMILGGCVLSQSDRFVVRESGNSFVMYPPGPLIDGHAEILVPGVVDRKSRAACHEIPIVAGQTEIGARLHPRYKLIGPQELVITVDASIRTDRSQVLAAIDTFLAAQFGAGVDGQLDCLVKDVSPIIKAAVINSVPVIYEEMLALAFDFDKESRSVDILPGQAFCVEYADGRFRRDTNGGTEGRRFFSGGTESCYRLDRDPGRTAHGLTFSPFLRAIGGINVLDRNKSSTRSAISRRVAGTVDLANRQSSAGINHYRLFYNNGIPHYEDQAPPIVKFNDTPLLIGGSCPGDMEIFKRIDTNAISDICVDPRPSDWKDAVRVAFNSMKTDNTVLAQKFSSCAGPDFDNWRPVCHLFNERGIPFPQVDIVIDGEPELVEMNRTVWHLLEQGVLHRYQDLLLDGASDSAVSKAMARELDELKVRRRFNGRTFPVNFEVFNMDVLMLPLLPGDEVSR